MANGFENGHYLVETDWLEAHLHDPDLRILDATVYLHPTLIGGLRMESGRENWAKEHIPGSAFVDLIEELSAPHPSYRFVAPAAEQFAAAMGRYGVGDGARVVIYDANHSMWATRVWWLLRVFGFDNAAILNGGWTKWKLEGRRVSNNDAARPPVTFVARPQPDLIVNKEIVLSALDDRATCVVNSLSADNHEQQRIASSINVPARSLLDSATGAYLPADELRQIFEAQGILNRERVITYCGAGIAATSDAFVLTLFGVKNVSVYSASMQEWAADPTLPTEKG